MCVCIYMYVYIYIHIRGALCPMRVRSPTLYPLPIFPLPFVPCILYTLIPLYPVYCILYPLHTVYCTHVHCILYNVYCILVYLYNCILLLTFYRAYGCLGAAPVPCGPPPRAPGAPPWGGSRPQSTKPNPWPTLLVFASKFRSILMSVWGRFGVDLGPLWGVIFAPFGALVALSWSQNRLRNVLSSKK